MASPKVTPPPDADDAVVTAEDVLPTMSDSEVLRLVSLMLRRRQSDAVDPCLVWKVPGNAQQGCIPLPKVVPDLSELAADILEVLVDAEGWLNGAEIGRRLNPTEPVNHTDGTFRRAVDQLKDADLIEKPSQRKGYKAKR